jgi:hypothetical protein
MPSAASFKRVLYLVGSALAVASVCYVLYQAYDERIWEAGAEVLGRLGVATALGIVVYSFASLLLAAAWHAVLGWCGEDNRPLTLSIGIYGRAQLAKYVPGNIFSLVGRQVLGSQAGFTHKGLAWASLFEVIGMLYAAGLLACAGASDWTSSMLGVPEPVFFVSVAALAVLPLLLLRALQRHGYMSRFALPRKSLRDYARLNIVFLIYVPFFVASGLIFGMLVLAVAPGTELAWGKTIGMVTAIWLIGYVTPGASAGIGVRDALLLLAIQPVIDGSLATLVVLAYRVVTIAGDIGFFGLAALVRLPMDVRRAHML